MNTTIDLTPAQLRERLLHDIFFDSPDFGQSPLEVNSDVLAAAFSDIILPVWCRAVGVNYRINPTPLPEFCSPTTIIFWPKPANPVLDICDDDSL